MLQTKKNDLSPIIIQNNQMQEYQEYEQSRICDFEFQYSHHKQDHNKISINLLVLIFIVLLVFICIQTFSITANLPDYNEEYVTFISSEQTKSRSHKNNKIHYNPIEKKIDTFIDKLQNLEKQLIQIEINKKNDVKNIQRALLHIKNIKKSIKQISSKTIIEQKFQQNQQVISKTYKFDIPKYIWSFQQTNQSYVTRLSQQNLKYYGKISNYIVKFISQSTYMSYFPDQTNLRLNTALSNIDSINERIPNAKKLKKFLILYNLLYEYGGVMIDGSFALTQDLGWISNITNSIIKLQGSKGITPQIIAFYKPQNSKRAKHNIQPFEGIQQVDKFTIEIPALQQFFMAAIQQSEFVGTLINKMYSLLNNIDFLDRERANHNLSYSKQLQFTKMIIYTSSQIVLKEKQKQIDELTYTSYKKFAFDYYGICLINAYYGPYKLDMIYSNFWKPMVPQISYHSSYFDLARYPYQDFLEYSGPIKYLCRLNNIDKMEVYLNNSAHGNDIEIYEGSLIQKLFFPEQKSVFIIPNPQKPFANKKNDIWTSLPKIIWIYWATGIINSSPFHQMCFSNIKRTANKTGFQVIQINSSNLNRYIPQKQLDHIQNSFSNAKTLLRIQSISDVYRLAVLYRHGGIYFDITSIGLDNFDWILDIGRFPSQYLFNRFGKTPKVLMSHHPYDGQPGTWTNIQLNQNQSVKSQWHLALQNSWIAAEKQSEFIKQWKDLFLEFIVQPYEKIEQKLIQSGVNQTRWTLPDNHYLLAMDAAKCVLGRRQKMLQKQNNGLLRNSAEYYRLWSFSSYLGPTKLRSNLNYDDPGQKMNAYLFRYPIEHVKQIIGDPRFYIKFFGYEVEQIQQFMMKHTSDNLTMDTHSRSFFQIYLWDDKFAHIIDRENKMLKEIK